VTEPPALRLVWERYPGAEPAWSGRRPDDGRRVAWVRRGCCHEYLFGALSDDEDRRLCQVQVGASGDLDAALTEAAEFALWGSSSLKPPAP
jgi:hypothetical protein